MMVTTTKQSILFFCVVGVLISFNAAYVPLVLMHGIGATNGTMGHIENLAHKLFPGIYTRAVEIGDGNFDSVFTSMDWQVKQFCETVKSDPNLKGGFNLMGCSQGGVITRGYLERCNDPPVLNYVSWVAPQQGVYGVPVVGHWEYLNVTLDAIADCCIYQSEIQDLVSFAGYWRDPFALNDYQKNCKYLPDVNNMNVANKNNSYKANILNLKNMLISYSLVDTTLIPRETGWFGVYAPNSDTEVIPLEQQQIWTEDWIGLRELSQTGRLTKFTTTCAHGDYSSSCFDTYFTKYVAPFLKLTYDEAIITPDILTVS